jgi:hypothetical protein
MDNCYIESGNIIATSAVLIENTHVKGGSINAGVPAKKVKEVSRELFEGKVGSMSKPGEEFKLNVDFDWFHPIPLEKRKANREELVIVTQNWKVKRLNYSRIYRQVDRQMRKKGLL